VAKPKLTHKHMFQYHLKAFIITEIISNLNTTRESVIIDFATAQYINKETSNKIYKIDTNGTITCHAKQWPTPHKYLKDLVDRTF
jgi:hypothetical protein